MGDRDGENREEYPADVASYREDCRQEGGERGRREGRKKYTESRRVRADSDCKAPVLLGS